MKIFQLSRVFLLLGVVSSFVSRVNTLTNTNKNVNTKFYSQLKNETDSSTDSDDDLILRIGTFMGYPPEKKWKGFRVMIYSFSIGMVLREMVNKYFERQNEIQDFFS
tara:strand:+ start:770 stop:1090 length:321 start_codon:yes stop_codon:yes gene_type:complete